jgi:competence protein ComEA
MKRLILGVLAAWLVVSVAPLAVAKEDKPVATPPATAAKGDPLDINTATEAQLIALPGIGEVRAKGIIAGRPYKGKDELVEKKIISEGEYKKIKDKIIAHQKK